MDGGEAVVETLLAWGVDTAFSVPGESYLPILAAIQRHRNRIRLVTPRHESGVTFAAEAYGKIARKPAAAFVSRGPGATNASIGIHTAAQDSTPLVLFIGNVPTTSSGREAFQEIDYHKMYGAIAKAVIEPRWARQIPEATARALALSTSGRPGPVVVVLPKDLIEGDAGEATIRPPSPPPLPSADPAAIRRAADLVNAAKRPLVISGEMVSFERATAALVRFAEASGAGVCAAYRRQDTFPNEHPAYCGHFEINRVPFQDKAWAECDLVIAVGARLDGITTQDFSMIRPDQKLIHVFPDPDVLSRWRSDVAIAADVGSALEALTAAVSAPGQERLGWRAALHESYLGFSKPGEVTVHGAVDMAKTVATVDALAPDDSVILCDSGTFARWVHRYYRFDRQGTQAGPMSGAMGYAVPGSLGTCLAKPEAPSIAFVGDGGFLMTGQELTAAVQHELPIKVILCDNNAWGSILTSQQKKFGAAGEFATRLKSPDFTAVAKGYGLPAWRVTRDDEFEPAFRECLAHPGPGLIHLMLDDRDISPFTADYKV